MPSDHYIVKQNAAPKATLDPIPEKFVTEYATDFSAASRDFWQKNFALFVADYSKGCITGKFGKNTLTLPDFLDRLYQGIRECITSELTKRNKTTEEIRQHFQLLDSTFKVLAKEIQNITTNNKINATCMLAFMQGFVNMYIESIVTKDRTPKEINDEN